MRYKKKLQQDIAELTIIVNFSYISKYLDRLDNYKLPQNPYTIKNGFLRKIFNITLKFKNELNKTYPISTKFNDNFFSALLDVDEELFDEQTLRLSRKKRLSNKEIVRNSIITMFNDMKFQAQKSDSKTVFEYCVMIEQRLRVLKSKMQKVSKNTLLSLICIYTVYYKKIRSLSDLSSKEMNLFKMSLEAFISNDVKVKSVVKAVLINDAFKDLLIENNSARTSFKTIMPKNATLVQNLYNEINYIYIHFLNKNDAGLLMRMKKINTQSTINVLKTLISITNIINEDVRIINRIQRSLRKVYMTLGSKSH